MSRLGRFASALALAPLGLLLAVAPSFASGGAQRCMDQAVNHDGELPTCTKVNGTWVASWPDEATAGGPSGGIPGWFGALFVLALLGGIAITVWKVTTARTLARQSGMDPGLATQMTLLSEDGLDATYLASSLRQQPAATPAPAAPTGPTKDVTSRLSELKGLLDRGVVTQSEYDARRQAIIDTV